MIGKVSGRVAYIAADHTLIEAAGVGYVVYCAPRVLAGMPRAGGAAALYTEMVVREDSMTLFGFPTLVEKEWHRLLTSVQGVGAKASLAILDALGPEGVSRAIALGDATAVKRAQGVGPKLALRVVNELRDKAPDVMALGALAARAATAPELDAAEAGAAPADPALEVEGAESAPEVEAPKRRKAKAASAPEAPDARAAAEADALSALVNLGYPAHEAAGAVAEAAGAAEAAGDAAALIKAALKGLAAKA
ncbi:MAG: Holliday junction branch migration protein RuvA [Pseudomonadota bacterium]